MKIGIGKIILKRLDQNCRVAEVIYKTSCLSNYVCVCVRACVRACVGVGGCV